MAPWPGRWRKARESETHQATPSAQGPVAPPVRVRNRAGASPKALGRPRTSSNRKARGKREPNQVLNRTGRARSRRSQGRLRLAARRSVSLAFGDNLRTQAGGVSWACSIPRSALSATLVIIQTISQYVRSVEGRGEVTAAQGRAGLSLVGLLWCRYGFLLFICS